MELRKVNNNESGGGYFIYVKIGNREYKSWWQAPPKDEELFDYSYLRDRYSIINTPKRAEQFSKLWIEMWKPKAKCIKGFLIEKCDDDGFTIPNKYFSIEEGQVWNVDTDENNNFIGGEIRLTRNVKRGCSWLEISKETFKEHFIEE
jgi:hypothetical protein